MQTALLLLLALLPAFAVAYYSVYSNDRFHTLFFLIYKSKPVLIYSFCYGLIGLFLYLLLKENVYAVTANNTLVGADYLKALGTGASVRAFSDINFFNIRGGGSVLPVGVKTFTQPLDKFFERKFNDAGYERSMQFLQPFYDKYKGKVSKMDVFKGKIVTLLKRFYLDQKQVGAFVTSDSFVKAAESDEVLALVLNEFGEAIFKRIFDKLDP